MQERAAAHKAWRIEQGKKLAEKAFAAQRSYSWHGELRRCDDDSLETAFSVSFNEFLSGFKIYRDLVHRCPGWTVVGDEEASRIRIAPGSNTNAGAPLYPFDLPTYEQAERLFDEHMAKLAAEEEYSRAKKAAAMNAFYLKLRTNLSKRMSDPSCFDIHFVWCKINESECPLGWRTLWEAFRRGVEDETLRTYTVRAVDVGTTQEPVVSFECFEL